MKTFSKPFVVASLSGLISVACGGAKTPPPSGTPPTGVGLPRSVGTALVTRGAAGVTTVPARIRSRQSAMISARTSALVMKAPFREGDSVSAGATLVVLDAAPQQAAVAAAEARLATADRESRRLISLQARDAATPREVEEITAQLETARAALASARDALNATSVRAPFSGRVVTKRVNAGDLARPGEPLLELQGGSALELVATLEASQMRMVRIGQSLKLRVDGLEGVMEATVHSIAPAADEATHRVDILCNLTPGPGLKPGLFARVELPVGSAEEPGSLRVPEAAVVRRGGLTGVFVVKNGQAWLRWIALGPDHDGWVEVRAGIEEGESVALEPAGLSDGLSVSGSQR